MKNRIINNAVVAEVANALKELKDQMIFVGGSVVNLYVDEEAAEEVRQTDDVDVTINLINYTAWVQMQERLAELGFSPDPEGHAICSYLYRGIPVDIMASEEGPLGGGNKWYKIGYDNLWIKKVREETINILSAPCFLATKFEAFNGRSGDYRASHDFEDIIYVLDNRTTIIEEIKNDHPEIIQFLKEEFTRVSASLSFEEIITCHVHPLIQEERVPIIKEKIEHIIAI
jgi:hypothetical protein